MDKGFVYLIYKLINRITAGQKKNQASITLLGFSGLEDYSGTTGGLWLMVVIKPGIMVINHVGC